jgi:hypothetical protein
MPLGRILLAWVAVVLWLIAWRWAETRGTRRRSPSKRELRDLAAEGALVTLFGALWFASLGAGAWWLPFLFLGALREWPIRSRRGALRILRLVGAGGLLAWVLPA